VFAGHEENCSNALAKLFFVALYLLHQPLYLLQYASKGLAPTLNT
jgi:hypothetical protein